MNNNQRRQSIDGFTLSRRSPAGPSANPMANKSGLDRPAIPHKFLRPHTERQQAESSAAPEILPKAQSPALGGLKRSDIDESLAAVDEPVQESRKQRRQRRKKQGGRKKRWLLWLALALVVFAVGYFVVKFVVATGRVFNGNVLDLFGSGVQLKADTNGQTNILLFGTSEDDPGHGGADLTDSIMVVSVNQEKKTAAIASMPRDMWVDYDAACAAGYSGKINAIYSCYASGGDEAAGANKLGQKVGEVFGLDVHYYVKVNYSVVRDLTTALGGVTVTIEAAFGANGIYDSNMGNLLKLPNGPATLQGEQALAFVRARGEGYGSYGINGNFSREQNQQKMVIAIRDKALNLGTLSNPVAINNLLDALGDNIRTNISTAEVKTLATVAKDIPETSITRIDLNKEGESVLSTGMYSGQSIVRPSAGIGEFGGIQAYIKKNLAGDSVLEEATIEVLNASSRVGLAKKKANELGEAGLTNVTIGDTASYTTGVAVTWYDMTDGKKPKVQSKLASVLGKQPAGATLPNGVQSTADFVIVLGGD